MSRFVSNPLAVTTDVDYGHGGEFVRRCLHLWQRSIWAGVHVEPWQLCGGFVYQMSDARTYLEALGDEPYRLRGESLQLIDEVPAPAKFTALWAHDLQQLKDKIKC